MNSPENSVYDGTASYGFFQLQGNDMNGEYVMWIGVHSDQIAGNYTRSDLYLLCTSLYKTVEDDTITIKLSDIRDFTVTGDATSCSTYVEMVSLDSVLYRINYVYDGQPTGVDNATESEYVVYYEGNAIVVNGAEGETMTVYDMVGKAIASKKAVSDVERIEIAVPGAYVVRIGDKSFKALAK